MNEWNQFLPRSRQRSMIRESQEIEMLIRYVAGKRNWHRLTKTHILLLFIHNLLHTLHKILDYKKKTSETMAELLYFFVTFFFAVAGVYRVCVCVHGIKPALNKNLFTRQLRKKILDNIRQLRREGRRRVQETTFCRQNLSWLLINLIMCLYCRTCVLLSSSSVAHWL